MNKVMKQDTCCKRCGFVLRETKDLSVSTKNHEFGRTEDKWDDDYDDDDYS